MASADTSGYLELAVQKSPDSLAAIWLWGEEDDIVGSEINVRVGGSFVWPPVNVPPSSLRKVVLVAGGVGINPLMSILSSIGDKPDGDYDVQLLYSMKDPGGERDAEGMLFIERIATIFAREKVKGSLDLFLTSTEKAEVTEDRDTIYCNEVEVPFVKRRLTVDDVVSAIDEDKASAVVYICGVPTMIDDMVKALTSQDGLGMESNRVLCERWW